MPEIKEHIEKIKMGKFGAPRIKEQVHTSVSLFRKMLLENKVLPSNNIFHTNLLSIF